MSESQIVVESWLQQLKQTGIFKISDVSFNRKKIDQRLVAAGETTSKISVKISSLSDTEKADIKQYLQSQIDTIDSNVISRLSKISSNDSIPSFVYFIVGSIIAYCFLEILSVPFSTLVLISLGLTLCLILVFLSNSKNRYFYNYLFSLVNN